jgi:predicted ArsR family transcriptional regulator
MDPELKALKEAELAEKRKNSNGRRGRPKKHTF